ncbi:hypothetical protein MTR_4g117240 [Medicago truncatula]|uniref:Uncharacterized protein n=1 Tax=Medicago truncatula TaxID=3880 RepID=A0A072V245_MEDTR|nr:hypothetical protein MTR_4g117240 [Medicago truncatula]
MGHPAMFHNPEEVMRLMQGIQSEWSMLEQVLALRRRSRSPRDGPKIKMPEKKDHKNEKVSGLIDATKFSGIAQASRHKWKSKVNSTL